ncbi:MAG: glycosyltransferase family 39 protein [Candidatus Methanoperedens sp.]|nr:glycosyltransferase family 39 protein [Candidatus Methanoperedens sp.]
MKKIKKKAVNNKINKDKLDYLILLVFFISIIVPVMIAPTQYYITQYGDDIAWISWAQNHHSNIIDIITNKVGTGYRPMISLFHALEYNLWGSNAFYYYLFNGLFISGSMVFLYLIGKILHSKFAGVVAVLLYLFLDGTFIAAEKIAFISTIGEIFFIVSAIYYSIKYINTKDKTSMWLSIILSILAFLTKEPSTLIIPSFILVYLYCKKELNIKYIALCLIPYLYDFVLIIFISPDVNAGGSNIYQVVMSNLNYYTDAEVNSQFKTPILLGISLFVATYYIYYKNLRTEIISCIAIIITAMLPFILTQRTVQPTYLMEANLGMVLLIGIVISEGFKKFNVITGLLIIGILFQVSMIPGQISNMQNYNNMISNNQKTFLETVESLKQLPSNETVFYFSNDIRQKYGMQLTEDFFKDYLCLRDLCNIKVVTSYADANYIILPSSLDVYTFQKEMPNEKPSVLKQIKNGDDYGYLLKK